VNGAALAVAQVLSPRVKLTVATPLALATEAATSKSAPTVTAAAGVVSVTVRGFAFSPQLHPQSAPRSAINERRMDFPPTESIMPGWARASVPRSLATSRHLWNVDPCAARSTSRQRRNTPCNICC
jgi:hypothetical protein